MINSKLKVVMVVALALRLLLSLPLVHGELGVTCENYSFTGQKLDDCNYILNSDLNDSEKLEMLDIIDQDTYDYQPDPIQNPDFIFIQLITDKTSYKPGDTIKVSIFPQGTKISITYGDETKIAEDQTDFIAKSGISEMQGDYQNSHYERFVNVRDKSPLVLLWDLFLFACVMYFVFSVLTKSGRIRKWLNAVFSI